jgi:hypothetical protein
MFEFLGCSRTWASTNATLKPLSSKAEMERRFFFKPYTNNTSLIEMGLPESS